MFAIKKFPVSTLSYVVRTSTQFSSLQGEIKPTPPLPNPPPQDSTVDLAKMRIYKNRSTLDLLNMLVMNTVCTKDIFVDNCHHLYKLSTKIAGSTITEALIGNTMGRIFTAGDSLKTVDEFITKWPNKNISLYIDYSNEAVPGQVITKKDLDDNAKVFCETIPLASKAGPNSGIAIKPSALCLHSTLVRANKAQQSIRSIFSSGFGNLKETMTSRQLMEELAEMKVDASFSEMKEFLALFFNKELNTEADLDVVTVNKFEWLNNVHAYDINAAKNKNKILSQLVNFSSEDYTELQFLVERMDSIFKRAYEEKSNVLVDAEQTYLQSTIDSLTVQFSLVYNKETPVVMNTFQNYLKTTKDRVLYELERCKAHGLPFAAKLVRGAYMVEERRLAKEKGYPDPIHNTVEETHECYNGNVKNVLQNWIQGSHLMVASHNDESIKLGGKLVKELGITPEKGTVTFIQLLGLADHLTYTTIGMGLTTSKYVPFGPISIMIPYLIRRAQESKQMLASASLQRSFVLGELGNRLRRM